LTVTVAGIEIAWAISSTLSISGATGAMYWAEIVDIEVVPIVYPSLRAFSISRDPTTPPPPGLFSTTKGTPKYSSIQFAIGRVRTSVIPPTDHGMITRTERSGYCVSSSGTPLPKA
jgi:hypothetical protein